MDLAVGRWILSAETQVRSQASSYCIVTLVCAGWVNNGASFLPGLPVFPFSIIPPLIHINWSVYHRLYITLITASVIK